MWKEPYLYGNYNVEDISPGRKWENRNTEMEFEYVDEIQKIHVDRITEGIREENNS